MIRLLKTTTAPLILAALACASATTANAQNLDSFGVLAGSTVTNTGPTVINGNLGVSPGSAITGFSVGNGIVIAPYAIYQNDAVAAEAQSQLTTLYNVLAGRPSTVNLTGQDLGSVGTLTAGVYSFNSSAQLTGTLTLDAQGDPNAVFIFNIESTLTTASASSVVLINGAQGGNVFFRVGSSATLGSDTTFNGQIVALTDITLVNGADITCGAALARNAAVTLDTNTITVCQLAAGSFDDGLDGEDDATDNEQALADAIDDYVSNGGVLPPGFLILAAALTPEELADALTQLSGEVATGVAPTGTRAMDAFLNLVTRPGFGNDRASRTAPEPARDTVRVLGYDTQAASATGSVFNALDRAPRAAMPDPRRWEFWAGGYGGHTDTDGESSVGSHDRSSTNFGVATGGEFRVTPDAEIGFALGAGKTDFDLSDNLGGGSSDVFQAALHARVGLDKAYLAAALAYAFHQVSTDRFVTVAGTDHFSADFDAHNIAGQLEVGYRIDWLTPYAAVQVQAFQTPDYSEDTESGASTFALSYEERTATTVRTELGARIEHAFRISETAHLALRASFGWAHDYWSETEVDASFQALPGSTFRVAGAEPASDSLLLSVGAEAQLDNGLSLAAGLDAELSEHSQTYAGTGRVSYRW